MSMTALRARSLLAAGLVALAAAGPAHAGLFDDDDARRAILDLRKQLEQSNEQARARQNEQMVQMSAQIDQLKRSLLDLNGTIDAQRADNAKLRGQMEELARVVAEVQRKQADIVQGVDERIRRVEPQKVSVDDKEFSVDAEEKRSYDEAMELLRKSDFAGTASALNAFRKRFPASGYNDSVLFWLGNAQYGNRQYKEAITSFRALVSAAPDHPKAPEAMLAIANCQAELRDTKSARQTINELIKAYPSSEAAQAGKERLATLK